MANLLTVKEAAKRLGYHPVHLRRLLRQGTVKGENFSGVWMIDPAEVERVKSLQSESGRLPKSARKAIPVYKPVKSQLPVSYNGREAPVGTARQPQPVKLIASLLTGDLALLTQVREALSQAFGPIDFESELLPFDHTEYYASEFGPDLQRQIVSFERLVDPGELPSIKRQTNDLEWSLSRDERRRVNIDPGYVSLGKMVLASTKDHAHRLYLGEGIYGEGTLVYQRGRFRAWPWTYPDYAGDDYCSMFEQIRERYKAQLRAPGI